MRPAWACAMAFYTMIHFFNFVGNDTAKETLDAMFRSRRFPHALILEGPEGSGRRTMARILAATLLCNGDGEAKPCGQCPHCHKALSGIHPDIMEAAGGSQARSFHVDVIRKIRGDIFIAPNEGACKIYILANAQSMSEQAQNALLKILEEPPSYGFFILTVTGRHMLLPTVLSRAPVIPLSAVPEAQAAAYVSKVLPDIEQEVICQAAGVYGGIIGQMLAGLQEGALQEVRNRTHRLCEALAQRDELAILKATAPFEKDNAFLLGCLNLLLLILRDAACMRQGSAIVLSGSPESARLLSDKLTLSQIMEGTSFLQTLKRAIQSNANNTLLISQLCIGLTERVASTKTKRGADR